MMETAKASLLKILCRTQIEIEARETGFVERKSPITGTAFLSAMVFGSQTTPDATLVELSSFLATSGGIAVSPQALDERFGNKSVAFMLACLRKVLAASWTMPHRVEALADFDHVYLMDSTNFNLASTLSGEFKGNGGNSSKSAMRIQFALDFCTGAMFQEIGDVDLSDQAALARMIDKRSVDFDGKALIITDLGYYRAKTISKICQMGAFFLSKVPHRRNYYKENGELLDLEGLINRRISSFDEIVLVDGARCRLVATRLDEQTAGARIRKANAHKACKQAGIISDDYKRFLHYSMFLTNLPEEYGMEKLYALYRIRWQVELVFKGWKSVLRIDRQKSAKAARVLCEVYGRLIAATVAAIIEGLAVAAQDQRIISKFKALKAFAAASDTLAKAVFGGKRMLAKAVDSLIIFIAKRCTKSTTKLRPHIEERLKLALA